ncbi:hypothetical protein [Pseudomonas sp. NPDC099000]|uniref:hypothetical protein n=1 Tax=Pseudomonas sp. NPDC099000 TaxID=3364488 RepID=UPI00383BDD0B
MSEPVMLLAESFWEEMAFEGSGPALWKSINDGLSNVFFSRLALLLDMQEIELAELLAIKVSTRRRWSKAGKLSCAESDLLYGVSEVFRDLLSLYEGDVNAALRWLDTPARALNHIPPASFFTNHVGIKLLKIHIWRIEHGVAG